MSINQQRRVVLLNAMAVVTAIAFPTISTASKPVEHQIIITDFKFEPDSLKIKAGDTITWLNKDIVPHTATATDKSWDTGIIDTNQSKLITFKKSSSATYFCIYHPMMKAKLNIIIED